LEWAVKAAAEVAKVIVKVVALLEVPKVLTTLVAEAAVGDLAL
jgi:hypothetical protein